MKNLKTILAAVAVFLAMPAGAQAHDGVAIVDAYARSSAAMATSGAVFMVIENHAEAEDRLVAAASDVAERVELHTHKEDANGVMQMIEVEEGFAIPALGSHALARGGDHVMLLGLKRSLAHGDSVTLTLTFERAGVIEVAVPVDLERKPAMGGMQDGAGHGHAHGQAPAAGN
jgi:periplasmic copper chaperone A